MKKFFLSLAVFVMALCANAQTNQYFWYNGNLMMGNPIAQIDSVTFGDGEPADTLHIMLPRTIIKTVHDTVYITIHDTICPNDLPEGALAGEFSVSSTKKVRFSKGNLQYQASTDTWRFAENQYDITGYTGYFNNTPNDEWIELFGWGTGDNPLKNDNNPGNYSNFVDWGTNFLEVTNNRSWRTLSDSEWGFLINERENHASLCAKAIVEGINGLIVFPDDFQNINTLEIQYGSIHPFSTNTFNSNQWKILEQKGAVFLPAAGWADNDYYQSPGIYDINIGGNYWSSTPYSNTLGYSVWFNDNSCNLHHYSGDQKSDKHSVRLVQDVE